MSFDLNRVQATITRNENKLTQAMLALDRAERALLECDLAPSGKELAELEADPRKREWLRSHGDRPLGDKREDLQARADEAATAVARLSRRSRALELLRAELAG